MAGEGIRQENADVLLSLSRGEGWLLLGTERGEKEMKLIKKIVCGVVLAGVALMLSGCPAQVGSERWCKNMRDNLT
ncbi:MAG: hypothetical protein D3910_27835, partial [Candidatus Electrothrix sp. ATG2]|nr:hypothetical protein [Candidatus Electrothrix sp. ATG2]